MSPPGSDVTTAPITPPKVSWKGMFAEILTVAPGQAAAGVKVMNVGAKTGETPANATRTTSNTIEIIL